MRYLSHFNEAEEKINKEFNSDRPQALTVNPMTIEHDHDKSWVNYMKTDLKAMMDCNAIYMLKGWHISEGANVEYHLAKNLKFEILFEQ